MVLSKNLEILYDTTCYLGESPLWHKRLNSSFWVDIENRNLYQLDWRTYEIKVRQLPERVGFIIEQADGNLLLGLQNFIAVYDLATDQLGRVVPVYPDFPELRCNDGYCDYEGRIWFGVMDLQATAHAGFLYSLFPGDILQKKIVGLTIPNGLVLAEDRQTMYFVDSKAQDVKAFKLVKGSSSLVFDRVVIHIPERSGSPDGMTIDEEGMLWIALYGGFCVIRCDPDTGNILGKISLPVPNVTNCCFAGPFLNDLIITTAREHLSVEDLARYPESGKVFVVRGIGVSGLPSNKSNFNPDNLPTK